MKFVLTLMLRDEIDIVSSVLDYHLAQGVDHVLVTDNGSIDGTRDVLADYARHAPLSIIDEPPSDWSQHRWVTRMAKLAFDTHGATWVAHTDADEFYVWPHGTLREALAKVPSDVDSLRIERNDFVPFNRPQEAAPPVEMVYRKALSLSMAGRRLPPKIIHRGVPDITVAQGNHSVSSPLLRSEPLASDVVTYHYPIRSLTQFESKARNAGSGYLINKELPPAIGHRMRHWYQLLQENRLEEEYQRLFFAAERLSNALSSGELLEERRLRDHLLSRC